MTRRRTLASLVAVKRIVVTALLVVPDAAASQNFPKVVQSELGLKTAPECTICHMDNNGGEGSAKQPFALALQRLGAVKKNDGLLIEALREAEARGIDSDGDCTPDIDELRAGKNPNVFDKADGGSEPDGGHSTTSCSPPPPLPPLLETGCSAAPRGTSHPCAAALAVCALLGARRTCRKKAPQRLRRSPGEGESSLFSGRPSGKESEQ